MIVKKYQSGGIYYTPFFRDSATNRQQVQGSQSKSDDKEDQLIQKEIINVLKENGLPNDVDYFLEKANAFLHKSSYLGELLGQSSSYDMSDLIRIQSLANRIKHNNSLHTQASNQIVKEGSGSEVAITNSGNMYVVDNEGQIKTISLSTYHNNRDDYQVLTNSDLIHLREEQPELAYNSTILTDLANTVGIKSIVEYVKSTIKQFGKDKTSSQNDHYTLKQRGEIERGLEAILSSSPDGIYKVTTGVAEEYQQNANQQEIAAAVNYLYDTLPSNMKNVLRAHTAAEGLNPNKASDVHRLLLQAVTEHTDRSRSITTKVDYDASASKAAGGEGTASDKDKEQTRPEMIVTAKPNDNLPIWGSSDTSAIIAPTRNVGKPMKKNGEQIGRATVVDLFTSDEIGHFVGLDSVSFGGEPVSEVDARRIMYDGVSDLYKAWLPVNNEVFQRTGQIVPDLDATERFKKFQEWIDAGYGVMPNTIQLKLQELNLDVSYDDETGQWYFNNLQGFIVTNGYVSSAALDNLDKKSKWLSHVDRSDGETIFNNYARIVNFGTETPTKNARSRDNVSRRWYRWDISENNSMYKSMIAVPITDPTVATLTTNHQLVSRDIYRDIFNRSEALQQSRSIKTQFDY